MENQKAWNPRIKAPTPKAGVLYRVIGPMMVNGMNVWRVHKIMEGGRIGDSIGPDCFSIEQAFDRAEDLTKGKKLFWFHNVEFTRKKIY